jgi:hypothetical protein
MEEEKKQEKARLSQQKLEGEMEAWRRRLLQHQKRVSYVHHLSGVMWGWVTAEMLHQG